MLISVIISLVILLTYVVWTSITYGVPDSISQSYYSLKWNPLFTIVIWTTTALITPPLMESAESTQIVPFLGIFGLFLVGAAPRVRDYDRVIHIIGACMAGIFSQLWIALYGNPWTLLMLFLPVGLMIWYGLDEEETMESVNFVFWTEITCYLSVYYNLILKFV